MAPRKRKKKKKSPQPDWEKLEVVIEAVHSFLAPGAEIRRNQKLQGKSGQERQLDVTISQHAGPIPIFIVIECKRYRRPVGIEKVESFVTKLRDVNGSVGVMISSSGFTAGARAAADQHNIHLKTYREANETDFWQRFVHANSWGNIITYEVHLNHIAMILEDGRRFENIPDNMILFNQQGNHYRDVDGEPWLVEDEFFQGFHRAERPRPIGNVELTLGGAHPTQYARLPNSLFPIDRFVMRGTIAAQRYSINLRLISGELLEAADTHDLEYIRARLGPIDTQEIIQNQEAIAFTNEEWLEWEQARTVENTIPLHGRYDLYVEAAMRPPES
jgi:hypothetical protein